MKYMYLVVKSHSTSLTPSCHSSIITTAYQLWASTLHPNPCLSLMDVLSTPQPLHVIHGCLQPLPGKYGCPLETRPPPTHTPAEPPPVTFGCSLYTPTPTCHLWMCSLHPNPCLSLRDVLSTPQPLPVT